MKRLQKNEALVQGDDMIAFFATEAQEEVDFDTYEKIECEASPLQIKNTWDIAG